MNIDRRLLGELIPVRAALGLAVVFGLVAGLLSVAQAYIVSQIVDRVFLDQQTLSDVTALLIALAVFAVIRAGSLWASTVNAHHVAGQIKADLRLRLVSHIAALGPAYIQGERSGELAAAAVEGIETLDAYLSEYLPQLALSVMLPCAMLIVVFPLDVLSGVVLLLTAPLIPVFMVLIGKLAAVQSQKQWQQLSRMSAHFLDVLQGLTTLKIFGHAKEQAAVIAWISDQFRDATLSVLRIAFLSALVLELLSTLSVAVIAVEIGLRLLYAHIPFDEAFFILILAPEYYLPLRALGVRFHAGTSGLAAAERIFAVLETPLSIREDLYTEPVPMDFRVPPHIRFDDVHFAYHNGVRPALRGVTCAIAPGQTVALVGTSGAGKSTMAHLLLRFIAPIAGSITVNDVDLDAIPLDVWRAQLAWVPQSPYLFAASIADNIRLANPDASMADVIHAARNAHAHTFIESLPQCYDTLIGERGVRLSGGQAQRIALARAFLKNAPFLILDEATANLDPDTEAQVVDAMQALMRDRTVLIIAHRLRTVQDADQIVVLDAGRVMEMGTHAELVQWGGAYHTLLAGQGNLP